MRFLALLVALTAFGQQKELASLEGQVVNGLTGEPLKKAVVTIRRSDGRGQMSSAATTDAGGAFVIRNLDPGAYSVFAERTGYVRVVRGARGSSALSLTAGQQKTGLVIKLTPQAVITGRVLDEEGDPAAGVSVRVLRQSYEGGRRQFVSAGGAVTDDQGEYRAHSLESGKYYISALARSQRAGPGQAEESYTTTYYPNALDLSGAALLNATAGVVLRGADITLSKARTVQVSGKVVGPDGGSLGRNTMVFAFPADNGVVSDGGRRNASPVDSQGRFVIRGLRPGAYMLSAERWDNRNRVSARLPLALGQVSLEGVELRLAPPLEVKGRIRVEGQDDAKLSGVRLLLQPRTGSAQQMGAAGGRVQDDGSFTLSNATPDLYSAVVMSAPEGCYLKSMTFGNEDALANGLNLARGAAAPLDIVLSPAGGSVDGAVVDARQQPAVGATVVAVPESRADSQQFYKVGTTGPNGTFTLKGLAPGDYKLYAFEEVEGNAWLDPEYRKAFERNGESLMVRENSKETKQLTLIPAGEK